MVWQRRQVYQLVFKLANTTYYYTWAGIYLKVSEILKIKKKSEN